MAFFLNFLPVNSKRILSITFLISTSVLLVVSGCRVKQDSTSGKRDITGLKTYAWVEQPPVNAKFGREERKKILDFDIKAEVAKELNSRGYQYTNSNPDMLINYKALMAKDNGEVTKVNISMSGNNGSGSVPNSNTTPIRSNELKVRIEVLNPSSRKVLWAGTTSRIIGEQMTMTYILENEVRVIMKKLKSR